MNQYPYTILYVDDESVNVELFKTIFLRLYNVQFAYSAIAGLEILKNNKVDLVITDEKMPGMTGIEFLKEISKLFPSVPPYRMLTSAYSTPSSIDEAFKHFQLNMFIPKPWKITELRTYVNEILEKNV
jgi:response regulator RpfG family c-di-GMP phosphodiesterase